MKNAQVPARRGKNGERLERKWKLILLQLLEVKFDLVKAAFQTAREELFVRRCIYEIDLA